MLFDGSVYPPYLRGTTWNLLERKTHRDQVQFQVAGVNPYPLFSLGFAAEGSMLVTASLGRVCWRNVGDGSLVHSLKEKIGPGSQVAVTAQGDQAVVLREDGIVFVASLNGWLKPVRGAGSSRATAIACASRGHCIAVGDDLGTVHVWGEDLQSPQNHWKLDDSPIVAVSFSEDGQRCAAISENGVVGVRDSLGLSDIERAQFPVHPVKDAVSNHDLELVCGNMQEAVVLWDRLQAQVISTHRDASRAAFTAAGTNELFVSTRSHVHRVQLDGSRSLIHAGDSRVRALAATPDGSRVAIGRIDGTVTILRVSPFNETPKFDPAPNTTYLAAFSPDAELLAIAGQEADSTHSLRVFRQSDSALVAEYLGLASRIHCLVFSNDRRTLAMSTRHGPVQIHVCDLESEQPPRTIESPGNRITCLSLSKDGRLFAGERETGAVLVYDVVSGSLIRRLQGPSTNCRKLRLFRNNSRLIAAHADGQICCWNTETFEIQWQINCGVAKLSDAILSPDEKRMAIAPQNGSFSVWRMNEDGMEWSAKLKSETSRATSLEFSPDGTILVAGDLSGQL